MKRLYKAVMLTFAAVVLCALLALIASAKSGDITGDCYYTDIVTYIYHAPITTYNIHA